MAQAHSETTLTQLKFIQDRGDLSEQEVTILDIFSHGMHPPTDETAAEAARKFDRSLPQLESVKEVRQHLWSIWDLMIDIARSPDVTSQIQERLVVIVAHLRLIARSTFKLSGTENRLWADLPLLPMCMGASFSDPYEESDDPTPESLQEWRNTNVFGARCMGAGVAGPYPAAMYAMRSALEEDVGVTECKIQVACEWISHAARPLLWWARENIGYIDVTVEDEANFVEAGPLYHGPATMCLERWAFWMQRFEEFGKEDSGMAEEIRDAALEAAQIMRRVESGKRARPVEDEVGKSENKAPEGGAPEDQVQEDKVENEGIQEGSASKKLKTDNCD